MTYNYNTIIIVDDNPTVLTALKTTGSGIGLSLARQMMMAQNGELWLADTPVTGYHTTFVLVFC